MLILVGEVGSSNEMNTIAGLSGRKGMCDLKVFMAIAKVWYSR